MKQRHTHRAWAFRSRKCIIHLANYSVKSGLFLKRKNPEGESPMAKSQKTNSKKQIPNSKFQIPNLQIPNLQPVSKFAPPRRFGMRTGEKIRLRRPVFQTTDRMIICSPIPGLKPRGYSLQAPLGLKKENINNLSI